MMNFTCVILAVASLAAGSEEFDRAAAEGAARLVINRIKADIANKPLAGNDLKESMLASPAAAAKRADAEKICRQVYRAAAEAQLKQQADEVLARLANGNGAVFSEEFRTEAARLGESKEKQMMSGPFAKAFAEARKAACDEQARTIAVKIRPSMSEADEDNDAKMRAALTQRIAASQSNAVFEENLGYISQKIVNPIIEDSKREKRRQGEYVRRVRSDAMAPSTLVADISAKLAANVESRKAQAKNSAMAWGIFPSVTNVTLKKAVERRIDDHFISKIAEVPHSIDVDQLAKEIASDRKAHRLASESERLVVTLRTVKLITDALNGVVADATEKERAELKKFLEGRISQQNVTRAVAARMAETVRPAWREARRKVTAGELSELWPTLADRTWYPQAAVADDICARADFAAAIAQWRKLPALRELDGEKDALEETEVEADRRVKEAFELARAAIVAQTKIVEGEMPGVLAESIKRKEGFWTRTPKLADIVAMLTEATEKRWSDTRLNTLWPIAGSAPANAAEQHAELFPSVRKKIELVARTILEEMQKEPEAKDEKPKEPEPDPTPAPEEEMEEELCTITFETRGDRVVVKAERGKKVLVERSAPMTATGFEQAVKEVGAVVGREVLKLK
jgi:hypothetical protein